MKTITDRHQFILKKLQEKGKVSIPQLVDEMQVSGVTIRKDLKLLEEKKLLFRTRGGGSVDNPYAIERPINEKEFIRADEKKKIAAAALGLIGQNDSIIIGSGTTVFEVARQLHPEKRIVVITPALKVSLELCNRPNVEVLQLGGLVHQSSSSAAGSFAEKILDELSCGVLFIGVDGIDLEHGLSITNIMEASLNQKMIGLAQTVVVLADSSKFDRRGLGKICNLDQIDYIITDSDVSREVVNKIEKAGVRVIIAE
ncbi:MAG: DeoR/GlpR transcriptional regulator [Terrimonas ferruginea]|uniref:DeoR/GlpR family DNA-binding transcription regulator n=1 Tax=Terrimonas ferruginea TaxID=249 RepID=UPI00092A90B4|nr:DeoR/GlpR family DNA-binding transcription regulator [Terrimonas ferruginea]MBN8784094.1 DeoR/GlpR transcriptional regulator [Terrimonas ferruginea]OJW39298.1 MAG: transcriptional regulator [Sphingobacteriales bacterium 48-107]